MFSLYEQLKSLLQKRAYVINYLMINSIHFLNFKAFQDFSIVLKDFNILTGPNNNGKSTILDGLRVLHSAYRFASRYNPKIINSPFGSAQYGYEIPSSSIPIILDNIQTDFNTSEPSTIKFKFDQGKVLSLYFHPEYPIYLFFDTPNKAPLTSSSFRKEFPLNISIVPTLGPFEVEEELLDLNYVKRWYGSRRSPRMFRSYWFYNLGDFAQFKSQVESTWPGMSILQPERKTGFSKELVMFFEENRMLREICWAGFGFQIWLQLLTHINNSKGADIMIVDEPEIYLHPDLQHKILDLLKKLNAKVILATHSVEIINSVEPTEVLLIDKKNKSAKRISDLLGLQSVSNILGSGQNIQLTRLARGKKILFVEGLDLRLLRRLSKICKFDDLFASGELTVIPIEGFTQHDKIIHTNWAFTKVLGEEIKIAILLDRDYRAEEELDSVLRKLSEEISLVHILKKKEIENYFIIPTAIQKVIEQKLEERIVAGTILQNPDIDISKLLDIIAEQLKADTKTQIVAHKAKANQKSAKDISTTITESSTKFEDDWTNPLFRFSVICGKSFFSLLNSHLQEYYKLSISYSKISNYIKLADLDNDITEFLIKLNAFKANS